jgi:hypothetical protein
LVGRQIDFGVVDDPVLEDVAEGVREEFLQHQPTAGAQISPSVVVGQRTQQVAVEVGFGAKSDGVDGQTGEIDIAGSKPFILKAVGHEQDRPWVRAGRIQRVLCRIQTPAYRRSASRHQVANLAHDEGRRADQRSLQGACDVRPALIHMRISVERDEPGAVAAHLDELVEERGSISRTFDLGSAGPVVFRHASRSVEHDHDVARSRRRRRWHDRGQDRRCREVEQVRADKVTARIAARKHTDYAPGHVV